MSMNDVENEAHELYEKDNGKFGEYKVWKEVMMFHNKWRIDGYSDQTIETILDDEWTRPNDETNKESDGSSKRSRINESGEYSIPSESDTPTSARGNDTSTGINGSSSSRYHPEGRDTTKSKGKKKTIETSIASEFMEKLHELNITRREETQLMKEKLALEAKLELERVENQTKRDEMRAIKMDKKILNTLLAKQCLTPEEENVKRFQLAKFYPM